MDNRTIQIALFSLLAVAVGVPVIQHALVLAAAPPAAAPAPPKPAPVVAATPVAHAPAAPASVRPPSPAVPALDPAAVRPGARLQCRFGAEWRGATVLHVLAQRAYVHFDGCSDAWNRWAPLADLRPRDRAVRPLPPLERPAAGVLEGVWLEPVSWPQVVPGSGLLPYVFRRDGTVIRGHTAAASVAKPFADVQRDDPACAGVYRVEGERVHIQWADGGLRVLALRRGPAGPELGGLQRAPAWTAAARLDGRFTPLRSAGGSSLPDRVFHADGTVTRERAPSADGIPDRGTTAAYEIAGNTLTLRTPRGDVRELIYALQGDGRQARLLAMGGTVYRRVEETID